MGEVTVAIVGENRRQMGVAIALCWRSFYGLANGPPCQHWRKGADKSKIGAVEGSAKVNFWLGVVLQNMNCETKKRRQHGILASAERPP